MSVLIQCVIYFFTAHVKKWWFLLKAKEILTELNQGNDQESDDEGPTVPGGNGWFEGFKKRHELSVRRATNVCQKEPADKMLDVRQFHLYIRRTAIDGQTISPLGQWYAASVANMDQTPLPFTFADGHTYADKGSKSVWVREANLVWKNISVLYS